MAIRHFRRKVALDASADANESSSSEVESSDGSIKNDELLHGERDDVKLAAKELKLSLKETSLYTDSSLTKSSFPSVDEGLVGRQQNGSNPSDIANKVHESNESDESPSESAGDSSSTSSSDSEVALHKPIYLKNLKRGATVDKASMKNCLPTETTTKQKTLLRIQHEHKVMKDVEQRAEFKSNYTTDKALLQQILELDDNDALDPTKEHEAWLERHKARDLRSRQELEVIQKELEDQESRKLSNTHAPDTSNSSRQTGLQFNVQDRRKRQRISSPETAQKSANSRSVFFQDDEIVIDKKTIPPNEIGTTKSHGSTKPQQLHKSDLSLKSSVVNTEGEDNEYSVI